MLLPGKICCDAGEADKEKSATVTVRVAGGWLVSPALSVTLKDTTCAPGDEKTILPGVASVLEDGDPPGKVHEYDAMVPSGSFPLPAKETGWPGLTVRSTAGLVMAAVGGVSVDGVSWMKLATEGTPEEFKIKSM